MRVAFIFPKFGDYWLGGVNYFRSLYQALACQDPQRVKPVLVVSPASQDEAKRHFPGIETIPSHFVRQGSFAHYLRKGIEYASGRDWLLENFLRRHQLSISSHGPGLGHHASIPSLCWIPDFQHLHLPEFCSKAEHRARTQRMLRMGARCTRLILSSQNARDDLSGFMPEVLPKVRVLRFAPLMPESVMLPLEQLETKYGFTGKYIFLPNQYWAHKNHLTVIAALQMLKTQDEKVQVISTGVKEDYRNPNHFQEVLRAIQAAGNGDLYKILGMIPYHDMLSLMYHSHALINPSLFEGWSTTVEEAKMLEKPLLLSDIPVHREQAADRALFFAPQSVSSCAEALKTMWRASAAPVNRHYRENAQAASLKFGKEYCAILEEIEK